MKFAVVGATSWGCTLAWLLEQGGHEVAVVCRDADEAAELNRNSGVERLPEVRLSEGSKGLSETVIRGVDGIVVAVPSQAFAKTLSRLSATEPLPVLSATKGIDHRTARRMSEISTDWPGAADVAVLSGPNLAAEIGRGLPAAAVVACSDDERAQWWQSVFNRPRFRVYTSTDVVGVEMGGALKNIVAIAAGATSGLGFGTNAVAALMTRGLAEMTRLGVAVGAEASTFQGLAGVGDLVATCFSDLSRNRRLGMLLAEGITPAEALARVGGVAEGAETARAAAELSRARGVEMPITEQVAAVVEGRASLGEAMAALLGRSPRPES